MENVVGSAADLAVELNVLIFDLKNRAALLGIKPASLRYAAYRHRISYVQYGCSKWFARDDLIDYGLMRSRGGKSRLTPKPYYIAKPCGWREGGRRTAQGSIGRLGQ